MYLLNLQTTNPWFNLAVEEHLLKYSDEEYLLIYINDPSVIIGKHQSGHMETNTKYVTYEHIPVIRRITGGGTVYHDNGNINFSFICKSETGKQVDFRKHTRPVIDFLNTLGVDAKFEGKNDLKVEGLKISGNAEHVHRNRVLHHGTLLFSTSIEALRNSIRQDKSDYTSRAVPSNPSPVINLNIIISFSMDILEFRSGMVNFFLKNFSDIIPGILTSEETAYAESLSETKYKSWDWNWAYGPGYIFNKSFEIGGRPYNCYMEVKDGIVGQCRINATDRMNNIPKIITGRRHMVNEFLDIFRKEKVPLTEDEVFNFF